jgi:hypothetical protein
MRATLQQVPPQKAATGRGLKSNPGNRGPAVWMAAYSEKAPLPSGEYSELRFVALDTSCCQKRLRHFGVAGCEERPLGRRESGPVVRERLDGGSSPC